MTTGMKRPGVTGWDSVQVGDRVQLVGSGRPEYVGLVDARTADGDIIWVHDPVDGAACSTFRMATTYSRPHHDRSGVLVTVTTAQDRETDQMPGRNGMPLSKTE